MVSVDLKGAYPQVPIHPESHIPSFKAVIGKRWFDFVMNQEVDLVAFRLHLYVPRLRLVVVDNLEDSMIHLSEVTSGDVGHNVLLEQANLQTAVKEEDVLSDGEVTNTQTSLTTSLDPSSPAVTSQVILNDPILSVSGEPLGQEEGLHQDHDDTDIVIV
ncbi:uncharacterized protein LOC135195749 [Macrobrachium nipponense]|uniref:uncharacterized protein LOC135195749 n=1 Tax=Macrobrachium nipponense TaxID=159736 RepID=UPI0030C86753